MEQMEQRGIKTWLVDEKDFPREGSTHDKLQFLLNYAVLAQSYFNSQPWTFSVEDSQINLYINASHWLKAADPDKREIYISLGCAMENLLIAAEHFKLGHKIYLFPDAGNENWVASVSFTTISQSTALRSPELFNAITRRHTYHHPFDSRAISDDDLKRLKKFLTEEDVMLTVSNDPEVKKRLSQFASHANTILYDNQSFRQALGKWSQKGNIGLPWNLPKSGLTDDTTMQGVAKRLNEQEQSILKSAPLVGVLSTVLDNPNNQIRAGQIFEKLCLEAALMGIQCLPFNQLIEVPEERMSLNELFPSLKGYPAVVFAMGYGEEEKVEDWSLRIPAEEVIEH